MEMILDVLDLLGRATWEPMWVPMLAWTTLALPLYLLLERTDRLHPRAEYRLSQVLLAVLPIGLVVANVTSLTPFPEPVQSLVANTVGNLPPTESLEQVNELRQPREASDAAISPSGAPISWKWTQAVGLVTVSFLLMSLVCLGQLLLDLASVVRIRSLETLASSASVAKQAHRIAERLDVTRPFRVCFVPGTNVPVTLVGLRPMIVLPPNLAKQDEALQLTLFHELVHLRRYDDLALFVERLAAALFAAHPLVARLRSHIGKARERACDTAVLDEAPTSSASYARLLATVAAPNQTFPAGFETLSLLESPSSLLKRIADMRSPLPTWFASSSRLGIALAGLTLTLTVGMVACTDSVAPSSPAVQPSSPGLADEATWTPFADARRAGGTWLKKLNNGEAAPTYEALLSSETLTSERWAKWVRERRAALGEETQRILHHVARRHGSERPSVTLNYGLEYASGAECGLSLEMVLVESTWNVASLGTLSCSGFLPPGLAPNDETSASRIMIGGSSELESKPSSDRLPAPVAGRTAVQEAIPNPGIAKKAQGIVVVEFFVEEDGNVTNAHVQDSLGDLISSHRTKQRPEELLHPLALQAIESTAFKPGRRDGQPVRTRMRLSVRFDCTMMRSAGLEQPCLPDE